MIKALLLSTLPLAFAGAPAARWGHQAVYVASQQSMYVVGGEVEASGAQITNEVLILPVRHPFSSGDTGAHVVQLNTTKPTFSQGPNGGLPPHAFASMAVSNDSASIVVVGGVTSSCSADALTHTFSLAGDGTWNDATPSNLVRRRGAGIAWVDNGSAGGEMMLVGGMADTYVCGEHPPDERCAFI